MEYINCNLCGLNKTSLLFKTKDYPFRKDIFNIVECMECGLIYTNPRPTVEEIDKYYPEEYYNSKFFCPPLFFPLEPKLTRRVKNFIKKKVMTIHYGYFSKTNKRSFKNVFLKIITLPLKYRINPLLPHYKKFGKVLDVGCGTGHYLFVLRELGWETYGIEMDEKSALWAKEKLALNVIAGKIEEMIFPSNYFDVITLRHTLEHLYDPSKVLKKIYQILKLNGLVMISIPNVDSWEARIFSKWWWRWDIPRHLFHFSSKTIIKLLNKEGFRSTKIEYTPDVLGIICSLQDFLLNKFPQRRSLIMKFFKPDMISQLCSLFTPLGYFAVLAKKAGNIVVYGQK